MHYSTTCNPQTGVWSSCCPRCWFWYFALSYDMCRVHSNSRHPELPQLTHGSLGYPAVDFQVSISLFSRKFGQYWILNWILQDNFLPIYNFVYYEHVKSFIWIWYLYVYLLWNLYVTLSPSLSIALTFITVRPESIVSCIVLSLLLVNVGASSFTFCMYTTTSDVML